MFTPPPVSSGWGLEAKAGPAIVWALWFKNVWNFLLKDKSRIYRSAAFTTTGGGWEKVPLDTASYDVTLPEVESAIDLANNRIIPRRTGYVQVNGRVSVTSTAAGNVVIVAIYLNGAEVSRGTEITSPSATSMGLSGTVADTILVNGTTDYIELWIYTSAALPLETGSAAAYLTVTGPI